MPKSSFSQERFARQHRLTEPKGRRETGAISQ